MDTLDKLESILGETRQGFKFEPIMEAVSNDDDSRLAGDIYRIMFGDVKNRDANIKALVKSFSTYFDITDEDLDDAKSVYDRGDEADHKREIAEAA